MSFRPWLNGRLRRMKHSGKRSAQGRNAERPPGGSWRSSTTWMPGSFRSRREASQDSSCSPLSMESRGKGTARLPGKRLLRTALPSTAESWTQPAGRRTSSGKRSLPCPPRAREKRFVLKVFPSSPIFSSEDMFLISQYGMLNRRPGIPFFLRRAPAPISPGRSSRPALPRSHRQ